MNRTTGPRQLERIMNYQKKLTLVSLWVALTTFTLATSADRQPNIVLILSDDQSYTDYGFMGHPHIETPRTSTKLASESALFRRGYVPTALCRPALMTLGDRSLLPPEQDHRQRSGRHARANAGPRRRRPARDARELLISHIDETGSLRPVARRRRAMSVTRAASGGRARTSAVASPRA